MTRDVKLTTESIGGRGTKLTSGGEPVHGITSIEVPRFGHGEAVKVNAEIYASCVEVEGRLVLQILHPATGQRKNVKSIVFEDGETWEC